MAIKRIFALLMVAIALVGCHKADVETLARPSTHRDYADLFASIDNTESRVYMNSDLSLAWHGDDHITVFYGNDHNNTFVFGGDTGDTEGGFSLVGLGGEGGTTLDCIYALYPQQATASIDETGVISLNIPEVQRYAEGSFPRNGNIMVAVTSATDDVDLSFKNGVGYLLLKLWGEGAVKSIDIESNAKERIAGRAEITATYGGEPQFSMTDTATTAIRLDCGEGVALSRDRSVPTEFYIAIPEVTFKQGITITVTDTDGAVFSKATQNEIAITRNRIKPMAALEAEFIAVRPSEKQLWYTTTDGLKLAFTGDAFNAAIDSQEYVDGVWVVTFADRLTAINSRAFESMTTLRSVVFPDSLTTIGDYAFRKCSSIEQINLPSSLESYGVNPFYGSTIADLTISCNLAGEAMEGGAVDTDRLPLYGADIRSITVASNVERIGGFALAWQKAYDITIEYGVKYLDDYALYDCDNISTITLPESVVSVGNNFMSGSSSLSEVYSLATTPPDLGESAFPSGVRVHVPDSAIAAYQMHPMWSAYTLTNFEGVLYESVDYSEDGEVVLLQRASKGNGIDIVVMGDGYSDRQIAAGLYEQDMRSAMEAIFSEEPFTTFRDHFNVYMVKCVSKREGVNNDQTYGDTAINCRVKADGVSISGDSWVPHGYTEAILGPERADEAMMMVIMNSRIYAGVCYISQPKINDSCDFANGPSLSYVPLCDDDTIFTQLVLHETCGHGFAKLGDEYYYTGNGHISSYDYGLSKDLEQWGWYKNVDFAFEGSLDATTVKWSHLLADERYSYDGLGVYEGALTYATGAYRPTENSIMHHRTEGFNAPSREAIYIRIHKLAYGKEWVYDYEDFVAYDAKNRKGEATRCVVSRPMESRPHAAPVVCDFSSWR